jgi:predicted nucleic acid-binding Zn ribbon protein
VPSTRYRCTACGNLTRFDVTSTVRSRAFHHYTVGGELERQDVEILNESVEDVSCRWCGSGGSVVELSADDALAEPQEAPEPA